VHSLGHKSHSGTYTVNDPKPTNNVEKSRLINKTNQSP